MRVPVPALSVAASVAGILVWLTPAVVWACGTFAVSVTAGEESPQWADDALVHDAEKMMYVDRGDGRWTVYQGRSIDADDAVDEFAWLLPVPGTPEVDVAPHLVFERLKEATRPEFSLHDESTGDCPAEVKTRGPDKSLGIDLGGGESQTVGHETDTDAVRSVDAGSVGPYDYVTIETQDGVDDAAEKAVEWLEKHDYHIGSIDVDLLREYLDDGLNLLAMRLRTDAKADDVQPVAITVEMDRALSPMRLARAGAAEETDIIVWTAAAGRAVPHGWPRVEIDEGLVNWADDGANYMDVVARAVEEAGGRGFVTDSLMDTDTGADHLWSDADQARWATIRDRDDFEGHEQQTLQAIAEIFDHDDLLAEILHDEMPSLSSDELQAQIEVGHFDAEYEADPFSSFSPKTPEYVLNRLQDGRLGPDCFDDALAINWRAGGHFAATIVNPEEQDEMLQDLDSSLDDRFSSCVREDIEAFIEDTTFVSGAFPMEIELRLSNPYELPGDDRGFPALMALSDEALASVDWKRVVTRIDEAIAAPLQRTADQLAATDRLTRLSAVVAAEHLTKDVSFSQRPGHRDRPPTRKATRRIECGGDEVTEDGRNYVVRDWSMTPKHGSPVTGRGKGWPLAIDDRDAARLVVEYDSSGQIVDKRGDAHDGEVESTGADAEAEDDE